MSRAKTINLATAAGAHRHSRPANRSQPEARRDWYRITNSADGNSATIAIYDEIGPWGTTAATFADELAQLDVTDLEVHLNSPGGDVYDGVAIYNALAQHPADVTVIVDGIAASIASIIAQAGDVRIMQRASQMMIHMPSALCVGTAVDMRECASMLDKAGEMLAQVYSDRASGSAKSWQAAMTRETWYSAEEAVSAGLADAVRGREAASANFDLSMYAYAGRQAAPAPPRIARYDPDALRRTIQEAAR